METASNKSHTVLIVDDNKELLEFFKISLALLDDIRIETAENGIQGLERCVELFPDCVVIDVKMPGLDGYELVRALRGDPATAYIPLVILTAMAQDKNRFIGLASGADQYLVKPVKAGALLESINEAIRISAEERKQRLLSLIDEDPPSADS
jgi:CheY-like chemotaxis protein